MAPYFPFCVVIESLIFSPQINIWGRLGETTFSPRSSETWSLAVERQLRSRSVHDSKREFNKVESSRISSVLIAPLVSGEQKSNQITSFSTVRRFTRGFSRHRGRTSFFRPFNPCGSYKSDYASVISVDVLEVKCYRPEDRGGIIPQTSYFHSTCRVYNVPLGFSVEIIHLEFHIKFCRFYRSNIRQHTDDWRLWVVWRSVKAANQMSSCDSFP